MYEIYFNFFIEGDNLLLQLIQGFVSKTFLVTLKIVCYLPNNFFKRFSIETK